MRLQRHLGIGLLSAGLTLGWAGLSRGQDKPPAEPPPPGERPQRGEGGGDRPARIEPGQMLERMRESFKDLNLSAEQEAKIKEIMEQARTDVAAAVKEAEALEPRERMAKVREVMQPVREKMMDVLDETQRERLRENMRGPGFGRPGGPGGPDGPPPGGPRERQRPGRDARPGPGGPPPGEGPDRPGAGERRPEPGMIIERLRRNLEQLDLNDEQKSKVEALLSETEKKMIDLRTEAEKAAVETRAKFRAAMEESRTQLEAILTDEQKSKLKEMRPERPPGGEGERRGGPEGRRGPGGPPPPPKE